MDYLTEVDRAKATIEQARNDAKLESPVPTAGLPKLRWLAYILLILLGATAFFAISFLSVPASERGPYLFTGLGTAILFVGLAVYFLLRVFGHFISNTDLPTWMVVLFILASFTTLGIALMLFALYLAFIYYPDRVNEETNLG
ncbi:hypothetical protein RY831_26930 [Noviherbaspirillum sp. CPCC 100848]|uniref:Transmembrane protein n=1 Tax=Noviherbaspirillum album TaxID=3080276 RepID=A0ABU6JGL0_9BURK|nr:hypothetical protein [Noviherbaspirillum sp. CPCC 100848]MEC4722799.1 hypothetical protein [Noviherbaspirillum sp. CPCC 100848]